MRKELISDLRMQHSGDLEVGFHAWCQEREHSRIIVTVHADAVQIWQNPVNGTIVNEATETCSKCCNYCGQHMFCNENGRVIFK